MGNGNKRIAIVTGTRPEIIKMAPIIKLLYNRGQDFLFIHTGQHYDFEMSLVFIEELGLPKPHKLLKLEKHSPAGQIAEIMTNLEKTLNEGNNKPSIMLIQGDTNSMLAAGLTAVKLGIKIGHVEAGLRSYDWRMPEEHNRRMIDHISDYLFAPTEASKKNLLDEHVWGEVYVTGNTVIDAIDMYKDKITGIQNQVLSKIRFREYGLITFHRSENVDNPSILRGFVKILEESPIPLVLPIHPRTKKRLEEQGLANHVYNLDNLQILPPQGYFEFLTLMRNAKVILTDSGGLQEEATHPFIRKPVLVLRNSTERPEAVSAGFARVVGVNPLIVISTLKEILEKYPALPDISPFGDGKAASRIVGIIYSKIN
ncbi:MAG: UDP-N-acetylglucosamine 2-epimerase (non-hydrolyzing) [Desulfurococcales archaeon]|nr:UDP-N-acetylglucosamine 2-epimerase (non-hydrolyzing) [Desulfurococcales archaeon]